MEHPVVVVLLLAGLAICFDTGESEAEGVTLQPENAIETTTSLPSSTEPQSLPAATSKTGQIIGEKEKVFVDPSNTMTTSGFQYITAYVESVLYRMSVGLADGQQTRVGFITYGTNATLHYNLSHWESSNELLNYMNLSLQSSVGTNIEAAIRLANDNFVLPHHRPNARKVIVIIASAFESGRYNDPVVAANTFKEDGGIIITIEYVQVHGAPVPMLDTLASPGYALTNRFGRVDVWELHKLFCKANCFCPTNYKPYKVKGDLPYGGCYKMSTLPAIQALAQRSCRRHFNGSLTTVETLGKAKFLTNMMRSNASFWIGLRYNNQAYRWTNGNAISDEDFKLWATHYPDSQQGDCVRMAKCDSCESKVAWYNEFCGMDLVYTCQTLACSTDHYCPVIR